MMKKILFIGFVVATATFSGCYYIGPCLNGSGPVITEVRDVEGFTGVCNTGSFDVYVTRADSFSVEVHAQENLMSIIETYVSGYTLTIQTQNGTCIKPSSTVKVYISMPETEFLRLSGSGRVFADIAESEEVEISNSGSGYMEIDTVIADTYIVSNAGSGYVSIVEGYMTEVDATQSGSGGIQCGILYGCAEVNMRHSSSGRIDAHIVDGTEIDVILSGSGRILLEGDLELAEYTLNSSGNIDAMELMASDVEATNTGSGNIFLWAEDLLDATVTGSGDIIYRGTPELKATDTGSGSIRSY